MPAVYACGCGMTVNQAAARNGHGSVNPTLCPTGCDVYVEPAPTGLQCNVVTQCSFGASLGDPGSDLHPYCIKPQYYQSGNTSNVVMLAQNEGSLSTLNCTGQAYATGNSCLDGDEDSTQQTWCSCSAATGPPSSTSNPCNLAAIQSSSTSPNSSPTNPIIDGTVRLDAMTTGSVGVLVVIFVLQIVVFCAV